MSDLKKAAQQALEALEALRKCITCWPDETWAPHEFAAMDRSSDAITALRTALAQQEQQEPVAEVVSRPERTGFGRVEDRKDVLFLADLPVGTMLYTHPPRRETKQEPVAWIQPDHLQKARQAPFLCRVEPTKRMSDFVPIYTHPPRREWQGLTDEELAELARQEQLLLICDDSDALREIARAIEAALKERNK